MNLGISTDYSGLPRSTSDGGRTSVHSQGFWEARRRDEAHEAHQSQAHGESTNICYDEFHL